MKEFLKDKKMRLALAIIMIAAVAVIGMLTWWAGGDDTTTTEDKPDGGNAYDIYESYELKEDVLADSGDAGDDTSGEQDSQYDETEPEPSDDDYAEEITYTFRYDNLLESHYEKHGIDMGFETAEDYLAAANAVINNPDALHKIEAEDGDDVYYVEATNEFVVVAPDGYIRTYFLPDDGIDYYNRQ